MFNYGLLCFLLPSKLYDDIAHFIPVEGTIVTISMKNRHTQRNDTVRVIWIEW